MTKQEIAKLLYFIDWEVVQSDDAYENHKVYDVILEELLKLSPEEAIRLVFKVLEAVSLEHIWGKASGSPLDSLKDFTDV